MAEAPAVVDTKSVAGNIVQGIQDKANGKPVEQKTEAVVDPNAGKEKYVVDGKDVWVSPEQRTAWIQKGIAFEPRVTQLAKLQQEANAFIETLKTDPEKILFNPKVGHSPKVILERIFNSGQIDDATKELVGKWYWENVVQPAKMSPEEREAVETKKKLSTYEQREREAAENAIKLENQAKVNTAMAQIKANIGEAMKESGLKSNDSALGVFMARRVADKMRLAYQQRQVLTPKQAIEQVKSELKSIQTSWYDDLDEEQLVKELGEKNAEKVKKYFLKLVKDSEKQTVVSKGPSVHGSKGERKTISPDDMRDYLENLKRENKPTQFKK
jgi:hypothetical protein